MHRSSANWRQCFPPYDMEAAVSSISPESIALAVIALLIAAERIPSIHSPSTSSVGLRVALSRGGYRNFHMGRPVKGPSKFWVGQQKWCIYVGQNFVWVGQARVWVGRGLPDPIARTATGVKLPFINHRYTGAVSVSAP